MKDDQVLIHPFTDAGLGKAPFKFVGVCEVPSKSLAEHNPTAYNNALRMLPKGYGVGSCAFCGMPLTYNFMINSADGKKFVVGCECVRKTGDAKLISKTDNAKRLIEKEKREERNRIRREKRAAERRAKVEKELAKQRKKNGGLTDAELFEKKRKDAERKRKRILTPLAAAISDGKGGFCDSVAESMARGEVPYGRGRDLVAEIIAKQVGRKGSKEYQRQEAAILKKLDRAEAVA